MNRRIIISEGEKKDILLKYYANDNLVVEQFDKTTAVYTTMNDNTLKKVTAPKDILIPKGTKVWHDFKGGGVRINLGNTGVFYDCTQAGYDYIFTDSDTLGNLRHENLSKVIRGYFCDGKKMKTWQQVTGTEKKTGNTVNKSVKLPNLTYKNFCELPGDKNWVYAKLDDGTWYTSKVTSKVDWFKLELPKYQKAVDLLNNNSRCSGLEEIPVLAVKQAEKINQTATDNNQTNLNPNTTTTGYQQKTASELLQNPFQQKNPLQSSTLR